MIQARVISYFYRGDPEPFYRVEFKKWLIWDMEGCYHKLEDAVTAANRIKANGGKKPKETVVYHV